MSFFNWLWRNAKKGGVNNDIPFSDRPAAPHPTFRRNKRLDAVLSATDRYVAIGNAVRDVQTGAIIFPAEAARIMSVHDRCMRIVDLTSIGRNTEEAGS